ncbi:MAG: hypothetical protein ACHQF2_09615, partial [Flavobacteriales bacterium]
TVQKMSGKILTGTILDTTAGDITINVTGKRKTRKVAIENPEIFSFRMANQPEIIMYRQDTAIGNFLPVNEQRYFMFGERDAQKKYNPIGFKIMSGLFTFGVSVLDTYSEDTVSHNVMKGLFRGTPGLAPLAACLVFPVLARLTTVELNLSKVSKREYLNHESYLDGYGEIARKKKIFGSFKYGVGGMLLGFGSYLLFNGLR